MSKKYLQVENVEKVMHINSELFYFIWFKNFIWMKFNLLI
jgi:hypothetical protein